MIDRKESDTVLGTKEYKYNLKYFQKGEIWEQLNACEGSL